MNLDLRKEDFWQQALKSESLLYWIITACRENTQFDSEYAETSWGLMRKRTSKQEEMKFEPQRRIFAP